jgi:hypothetical protein
MTYIDINIDPADRDEVMGPRTLTVMEAHAAADCPDRSTCWAKDIHDKHDPDKCACGDGRKCAMHAAALRNRVASMDIWHAVALERISAHDKHGSTSMESAPADDPTGRRLRILLEEVGEVAQEFNDAEHERRPVDLGRVRKELIQVAAMAGAWADVCA